MLTRNELLTATERLSNAHAGLAESLAAFHKRRAELELQLNRAEWNTSQAELDRLRHMFGLLESDVSRTHESLKAIEAETMAIKSHFGSQKSRLESELARRQ